jgi:curved DNA-binding protein CbpA
MPPLPTDPAQCINRLLQCPDQDLYLILNVTKEATAAEIKKSYLKQSLKVHPDKHAGDGRSSAEEAFKKLTFANEILGDPDVRARYDFERNDQVQQQFSEIEMYLRELKERREAAKRQVYCNVCGVRKLFLLRSLHPFVSLEHVSGALSSAVAGTA